MKQPANHNPEVLRLPDVSVETLDAGHGFSRTRRTFTDALNSWLESDSNLLVVMGAFGTGKTTALTSFAAQREDTFLLNFDSFRSAVEPEQPSPRPRSSTVILDNFDALNTLSGFQTERPNLRHIAHLADTTRVVVATRRSPMQSDDELIGQLKTRQRCAQLGFRRPMILQIMPWTFAELQDHANTLAPPDESLTAVLAYLKTLHPSEGEQLRTPLLLNMLVSLVPRFAQLNERPSLASIYEEYCSIALAADYDGARSRIPGNVKLDILADLAYDIFSGIESDDGMTGPPLTLPVARVSERVLEALERTLLYRQRKGVDRYEWTDDFLATNHIMLRVPPVRLATFTDPLFGFVHESFYEYFVGIALCKRIASGPKWPLGLEISKLTAVDSLVFAFAKEAGGMQLREAIRGIVLRPHLRIADRLVLFYFLEDEADFSALLGAAPPEYMDELLQYEPAVTNFFVKKMIRYQLVVAGRYDAARYVDDVRHYEDDLALRAEARLLSSEREATKQLLSRLRNPALERARLITIYRLGQLGDGSAIEPLQWLATGAGGTVAAAARDAIGAIRKRLGEST